ncbi:MAG: DUF2628 domain-containing protein [Rhizobiaceae bacterium]
MIYTIYGGEGSGGGGGGGGGGGEELRAEDVIRLDQLKAVPEGPAVWALIVPPLWLIAHRLWWPLAYCLLYWMFCLGLLATPFATVTPFIFGLPGLYLMLEGWELVRRRLEADGLTLIGLIDAGDEQAAIGRFLDAQQKQARHSPPSDDSFFGSTATTTKVSPQLSQSAGDSAPAFGLFSPRES